MLLDSALIFLDIPKKDLELDYVAKCLTSDLGKKIFTGIFEKRQQIYSNSSKPKSLIEFLNVFCRFNIGLYGLMGIQNFRILPAEFAVKEYPEFTKRRFYDTLSLYPYLTDEEKLCQKNVIFFEMLQTAIKPYIENDDKSLIILNSTDARYETIHPDRFVLRSTGICKFVPRLEIRLGRERKKIRHILYNR